MSEAFGALFIPMVVLPLIALAIYLATGTYVGGRRYASLDEFAQAVVSRTGLAAVRDGGVWFSSLVNVCFLGQLGSGRRAKVHFVRHQAGKSSYFTAHFSVALDDVQFEVTPESFLARLGAWLGFGDDLHTGDAGFDAAYWVQSPSPSRDRTLEAMSSGLSLVVESLFQRFGARRLAADGSWLEAEFHSSGVDPESYAVVLDELARGARAFGRVAIPVRVIGLVRRAVAGSRGATRCALCHGGITADELDLVACDRCHTVLHDECWQELRRCPLLGCAGRSPERARARAG